MSAGGDNKGSSGIIIAADGYSVLVEKMSIARNESNAVVLDKLCISFGEM